MLRLLAALALFAFAAIVLCTVLAHVLAVQADDHLEAEGRQALANAIEALQVLTPDIERADTKVMAFLERASALKGLRFEQEPVQSGRQVQSIMDGNGRIAGWFSWEQERPASSMVRKLLPFASLAGFALVGFAALAIRQVQRLNVLLASHANQMDKLEFEDPVTGLPNRSHFFARLDQALAGRKESQVLALAVLDLDAFDEVNDAMGYAAGDAVLAQIGKRLSEVLPRDSVIGRLDSDGFAIMLVRADVDLMVRAIESAAAALARPHWIDRLVQVSATIGVALAPRDGTDRDELFRRAHLALRTAKRRGRGRIGKASAEMEAEFQEQRFIKREAARALAAREFDLHYQPIVQAENGKVSGVEALLRWSHPLRGQIPPSLFVPIVEDAGLMDRLGEFVLRRALADAARWPHIYVSVNISPVQVRDRCFIETLASALRDSAMDPSRLVLEMTENVLIEDREEMTERLLEMRALGVRLALDDFGSGYSSLSYLQTLPFDRLKVDRSFVAALGRSANGGVIIQAIVALGRALGMGVVMEGVETEEQRVLLTLAGCNEMQGYLFAKPSAREAIDRLFARRSAPLDVPLLMANG
ncbi:MAG: putative bifunctional diguanylate cyclase/phosphodiesterase [Xanthobacteraceae bacterium]